MTEPYVDSRRAPATTFNFKNAAEFMTPLQAAAHEGHDAVIDALVQGGAALEEVTDKGGTALHLAAQNGHIDAVRALLRHGAAVDARGPGQVTPLVLAAQNGFA